MDLKFKTLLLIMSLLIPFSGAAITNNSETPIRGDMNNDGNVNVADIDILVDIIMKGSNCESCIKGDLNNDGNVNVADIAILVNIIKKGCNSSEPTHEESKHLKICILGNSYAADCWRYVPIMLLQYGITCDVYLYYRGSGSLNDLNSQWEDYATRGIAESDNAQHARFCSHFDSRTMTSWEDYPTTLDEHENTINTLCAKDLVEIGNTIGGWDLITLQQVSVFTDVDPDNDVNGRYANLNNLIKTIKSYCDNPFNLAWFESYTRARHDSQTIRYNSLTNQEKVFCRYPFSMVIPVASAVFYCRENTDLVQLGDYTKHNLWASDGIHLQEGLPCYIGALTVIQSLFNYFGIAKSVLNNGFRPTQDVIRSIGLSRTVNGQSIGVTEENCELAQKAAIMACNFPFALSLSN